MTIDPVVAGALIEKHIRESTPRKLARELLEMAARSYQAIERGELGFMTVTRPENAHLPPAEQAELYRRDFVATWGMEIDKYLANPEAFLARFPGA